MMRNARHLRGALLAIVCQWVVLPSMALSAGLTISPSVLTLSPGQIFVVTVGLDPAAELQGYTLDIEFDSGELTFIGATQLGSSELASSPGVFEQLPFTIDPSNALATGEPGRASVLVAPDAAGSAQSAQSVVFIDGRTSVPAPAPVGLFQLQFQATSNLVLDGADDITVGLLDAFASDVTASLRTGGASIPLSPAQVSVMDVPEPSFVALLNWGVLFLFGLSRLARRASTTVA
jgi:hypothetical protein